MKREVANAFGKVFLTIEYEPQNNLTCNTWQGYLTLDSIMNAANIGLEMLAVTKCPHLLNNNTHVTGPWDHAVAWIAQDWTPRAIDLGLTHFAHVVDAKSFAALSAEAMVSGVAGLFEMRIFGNVADARQWLHEARQQGRLSRTAFFLKQ